MKVPFKSLKFLPSKTCIFIFILVSLNLRKKENDDKWLACRFKRFLNELIDTLWVTEI